MLTGWFTDLENDGYNGVPYIPANNYLAGSPNPDFDPAPPNSAPLGGFYDNFSAEGNNYGSSEQGGANLALNFELGFATLRSITGYADVKDKFGFDLAGGGFPVDLEPDGTVDFYAPGLLIQSDSTMEQWSEEIQLLGTAFGDRLNWMVGLFYLNEKGDQTFSGTLVAPPAAFSEQIASETDSYAVFADLSYQVTEALAISGGVRWTKDEKSFSDDCVGEFCQSDDSPFGSGAASVAYEDSWDEVTFKLGADYRLSDSQMVYATFSQGFQAGGFRTLCFGNLTSDIPELGIRGCGGSTFDPQTVDSFELGWKSDLFDNRLRLNVAAFYSMYDDIQQLVIQQFDFDEDGTADVTNFPIDNIGEVDVYGIEVEVTWSPIKELNVYANLGVQESDFGTVDPASPPGGFNGQAPRVKELPSNPQWQAKIGFDYTIPLQNSLAFFYGLDLFHSDSYFSESRELIEIDDYTRLNGFIGLGADDRQWQVVLYAKNITDEEDNVSGIFSNGFTNIRTPLPPAEYMLTFKVNY